MLAQNTSILSQITELFSKESLIVGLILCGSSNLNNEDFHLDLMILITDEKANERIKQIIDTFPTKINYIVKLVNDLDKIEPIIIQNIFKDGKIIYWNGALDIPASQLFKLKPYSLFTFELSGMTQVMKVQFNYQLYGKKNNGQLNEWGGIRVTKSCFYVPHVNKYKVARFFSKFSIKTHDFDVWI